MYQAPRGTVDILPEEQPYWQYIISRAETICQRYGYERIETPIFEDASLFRRGVGEDTDIVEKEMYVFNDLGGNQLALRPEGTASVCRAYLQHGMQNLPQPVKLFYTAPVFRYERPQAGRYRQHHQFGYEVIGDGNPSVDAEVIDLAWQFYRELGFNKLSLKLNSIGCSQCRPQYHQALKEYYRDKTDLLCRDCKSRLERNPLRLLDCKKPGCQPIADNSPKSSEHLCPECAAHFNELKHYLELLGIPFSVDHRLVRGLDYYTRTVFEIQPPDVAGQSTIGGGGRYDGLIQELGGKDTPAIGFATGMERIILNLKKQQITPPATAKPEVFIADTGESDVRSQAVLLTAELRRSGIRVVNASAGRSLKAQLRQAGKLGVRLSIIIGETEMASGSVIIRDMRKAEQSTVSRVDLLTRLGDLLSAPD